ncbi:5-oxoprolinase subunit PxpA [Gammaproteobacteria bacterium LSUCC0112]|nr:5-oxoprolinase subunit PxpA [Gammaproteobacteria bacterium LSUCC0112]
MNRHIDLNADLGEGGAFDRELLTVVSSANISCGAHAGSEQDIRQAIRWAIENGVVIGAHPSYPDREHWGRRSMTLSAEQLRDTVMAQLQWLERQVNELGGELHHIKPHGALYNDAAGDAQLARQIARCVKDFDPSLILVGLANSQLLTEGKQAGLKVAAEAFVDRRYRVDGTLVPRSQAQAMIEDTTEALAQSMALIHGSPINVLDGHMISIKADTLCLHGDSAHALAFATALRTALLSQGIHILALANNQFA